MNDEDVKLTPAFWNAMTATEAAILRERFLDPNRAKTEAEHWACRELTRLSARVEELERGLEGLELLFARPEDNSIDHFERVADAFYLQTGYLRPGKDCVLHDPAVRCAAWEEWRASKISTARSLLSPSTNLKE